MIKKWTTFNEEISWFSSKDTPKEEPKSGPRIMSSTQRPSPEETEKIQKDLQNLKRPIEPKIDVSFLQEVSDRLYGPDSEEYVKALQEINQRFRPRPGKRGHEFFDPEIQDKVNKRYEEIKKMIKDK